MEKRNGSAVYRTPTYDELVVLVRTSTEELMALQDEMDELKVALRTLYGQDTGLTPMEAGQLLESRRVDM